MHKYEYVEDKGGVGRISAPHSRSIEKNNCPRSNLCLGLFRINVLWCPGLDKVHTKKCVYNHLETCSFEMFYLSKTTIVLLFNLRSVKITSVTLSTVAALWR